MARAFTVTRNAAVTFAAVMATACTRESTHDEFANLPRITVATTPSFSLRDDGTPEHAFTRISARRLANGNIAIHDEPANRIVVFDRNGKVVRELTHRGSGPGEMDQPFRITSVGDTIIALPLPLVMPASVFVADKGFVERYAPSANNYAGTMSAVTRLSNHRWLVKKTSGFRALTAAPVIGAITADTLALGIVSIGNSPQTTNVIWLPPFVAAWSVGAAMSKASPMPVLPTSFPMKGATLYAVSGAQVWLADAENGAMAIFDSTASAIFHDTLVITRRPFVSGELAAARSAELENTRSPFMRDMIEGRYNTKPMPAAMPLFSAMYAGANGEVWLQLYDINPDAVQSFTVFAPSGKRIATATLPAALHVQQFGKDFVLALVNDSLGVQSVLEYKLKRD